MYNHESSNENYILIIMIKSKKGLILVIILLLMIKLTFVHIQSLIAHSKQSLFPGFK